MGKVASIHSKRSDAALIAAADRKVRSHDLRLLEAVWLIRAPELIHVVACFDSQDTWRALGQYPTMDDALADAKLIAEYFDKPVKDITGVGDF